MSVLVTQDCAGVSGSGARRFQSKNVLALAREILIRIFDALGDWQDRARERHQLMAMSDRGLRDLGLARTDINIGGSIEGSRRFWKRY